MHDLTALLPKVWLHRDPRTARQRGRDTLLRFRMDFLLLLPCGERIVLEVDGAHHYASPEGSRPDPARYADGVCGDRELKLAGYGVFRLGATELPDPLDRRVTRLARARRPAAASGRPVAKNLPRAQGPATSCPSTATP